MIRRPPRSTPFPTRRSSDLGREDHGNDQSPEEGHHPRDAPSSRAVWRRRLPLGPEGGGDSHHCEDRKSTRLNSSHDQISYAVFCLKKKKELYPVRDISLDMP